MYNSENKPWLLGKFKVTFNPLNLEPLIVTASNSKEVIEKLEQLDELLPFVENSLWNLMNDSIKSSMRNLMNDSIYQHIYYSMYDSMRNSIQDSVLASLIVRFQEKDCKFLFRDGVFETILYDKVIEISEIYTWFSEFGLLPHEDSSKKYLLVSWKNPKYVQTISIKNGECT